MKIGIIVAMQAELACVEGILTDRHETEGTGGARFITGKAGNHDIILLQSGIGKVCAAVRAYELIRRFAPRLYYQHRRCRRYRPHYTHYGHGSGDGSGLSRRMVWRR